MVKTIVMTVLIACLATGMAVHAETIRFAPLPSFALVANTSTLPPQLISRIRRELIALDPDCRDRTPLASWGDNIRFGAVSATDDDYQVVRELLAGAVIPDKGNF